MFEIKEHVLSERTERMDREIFKVSRCHGGDLLVSVNSSYWGNATFVMLQTYRRTWEELGFFFIEDGVLKILDMGETLIQETRDDISSAEILYTLLEYTQERERLGSLLAS